MSSWDKKTWVCNACGNTERFVAIGSYPVSCIVSGDYEEILSIEVLDDNSPDPDSPEYCAVCDSEDIDYVSKEELNDDNNERVAR